MASALTFSCFFLLLSAVAFADMGVNYGRIANNLPPPDKVVQLLKSKGISKVKIYDVDATVLTAFANSGISLIVCMPNDLLSKAAGDQAFVDKWVEDNISKFAANTKIEAIAVGNEVLDDQKNTPFLVNAMKNVVNSLAKAKLDIKVSSPLSSSCLKASFPPSAGAFKDELVDNVMKPMLDLLSKSGSYLMINIYPFFAYSANSKDINLDYALLKDNQGVVDSGNQVKYPSLFEAEIDAVYAAMSAIGFKDLKLAVTETGWPSAGDEKEVGASKENAAAFNGNLWNKFKNYGGTPTSKNVVSVYIFALFNENQKTGPTSEKNYGLFFPDQQKVYDMPF